MGVKEEYTTPMNKETVTTKIKRESLRKLKAIAALQQETMLAVLERLIDTELTRVLKQEKPEP